MSNTNIENAEQMLFELISSGGPKYLHRDPMRVYDDLLAGGIPEKLARVLLSAILAGAPQKALTVSEEDLSTDLQDSCALQKGAADEAAQIFKQLFSVSNQESWKAQSGAGFRELCENPWPFAWAGSAVWSHEDGYSPFSAQLTATLSVINAELARKTAEYRLQRNPFATASEIAVPFAHKLSQALDETLVYYVTSEEYTEQAMEDFPPVLEIELRLHCEKLGVRADSCNIRITDSENGLD